MGFSRLTSGFSNSKANLKQENIGFVLDFHWVAWFVTMLYWHWKTCSKPTCTWEGTGNPLKSNMLNQHESAQIFRCWIHLHIEMHWSALKSLSHLHPVGFSIVPWSPQLGSLSLAISLFLPPDRQSSPS